MEKYLRETKMLDYSSKNIQRLIQERNRVRKKQSESKKTEIERRRRKSIEKKRKNRYDRLV